MKRSIDPWPNPKTPAPRRPGRLRAAVAKMTARLTSWNTALANPVMISVATRLPGINILRTKGTTKSAVWLNTNETPPSAQPFSDRAQVAAATALPTMRSPMPTRAKVKAEEAASSAAGDGRSTEITGGAWRASASVRDDRRDRQRRRCQPHSTSSRSAG